MKKIFLTAIFLLISSTVFSQWIWQNQYSGTTTSRLRSVFFTDNNTGWIASNGSILHTTNGGINWTNQANYLGNFEAWSLHFIDHNTGWVAGDKGVERVVLSTTNGGINWNLQTLGYNRFISIYFIDNNTGWVSSYHQVYKTTNSGLNWVGLLSNDSIWGARSVYFVNNNTGWFVGDNGRIMKTTNGGYNWVRQTSGTTEDFRSVYFIDNSTGWTVGGDAFFYSHSGIILKTTNGGINWFGQSTAYEYETLYSVHFINNSTGWIAGDNGTILSTSNSGTNWIYNSSGTSESLESIFFADVNSGWAVGNHGTILKRMDINSVHDLGVASIIEPAPNSDFYVDCNSSYTVNPKCSIKNFGINDESNFFDVHFEIKLNNTVVYSDIKQDTISAGQTHTINFNSTSIPENSDGDFDEYDVKVWTSLQTETNWINDTMKSNFNSSNPNYRYFYFSDPNYFGYYFLNSSPNASCIPGQPVFNWEDTTGSVSLIINGVPQIPFKESNYSVGYFILPDIIPNGNKFKFFESCYDTLVISTNGIIGLGNSTAGMLSSDPVSIPSVSAPKPAIFPFWYPCNFQDPEIIGRNLKYKITADKFIITYDRFPVYNTVYDSNDYVSYQVILQTGPGCVSENGSIKVQYDYNKCGSSFISHYNSGSLNAMTVGIQNSTGTNSLQYRRSESNHTVTVPGPLFDSPLVVEFAPVNSVLPVELQTFTSSVIENDVSLLWVVNSQINNSRFDVERSKVNHQTSNGWIKIASVAGDDSTYNAQQYSYADKNLSTGKYNYRLKQIDFNGSFKYYELPYEVVIGIPLKFKLSQNYPNPFNPVTKINYDIAVDSKVSLTIYDAVGRQLETMVNEFKTAGYYSVDFNGRNFASGVYFYKLEANGYIETKRMMLLK